ncbi:uncharacterized protein LOC107370453 [Tetranychus urticae]|uniref:uncharacterized protein LOC107370453 n=1 Tax=Tetranychus urticae TaxID=32264 RepID=UPI00077BB6E1|nr:uncharacterized protein LOC107370453 [Tetranychus urticae]
MRLKRQSVNTRSNVQKIAMRRIRATRISNSQTAGPSTAGPSVIGTGSSSRDSSPENFAIPRVDYGDYHRPLFLFNCDSSDSSVTSEIQVNEMQQNVEIEHSSSDETIIYKPPSSINWNYLVNYTSKRFVYPDIPYNMTPANQCYPAAWLRKAVKFDRIIEKNDWHFCEHCKRRFLNLTITSVSVHGLNSQNWCNKCVKNPDLYTDANFMDPREQPEVLKNLTMVEEMLIAKVHPVVRLYKIKGQQFAYSGHVVNFEQDITNLHTKLPVNPKDLRGIIIVNRDTPDGIASFQVRSSKVREALCWLKRNHMYYHDIEIDDEQLSQLPENGNIMQLLPNLNRDSRQDGSQSDEMQLMQESNFPHIPQMNQESKVRDATEIIEWPHIRPDPISEFRTEGYITQAFPTLFPYGRADFKQSRNVKSLSFVEYFKFLMQYKDGRFAKDSRFRFFAFNSIMRWQAINQGNLYVKKNKFGNLDAEAVLEKVKEDSHLADSIMFYAGKLRSSKSYWFQRSGELHDMVEQLSTPHIFFTLSAADYHWPDLYKILDPTNNIDTSIEANRRRLMHDNPLITAWFFQKRAETFIREVLLPCYNVDDYWYRYEWQWRGSPHIHGVLWLKDGPKLENLDDVTDEQLSYLTNFCARLSRAWNPDITHAPSDIHPSRKRFTEILEDPEDLTTILNRLQRHTRHGTHCLRKKRGTNVEACRFGFPHELSDVDVIAKDKNWKFEPKRNDENMAKYNPFVTQTWRGNTDFTPILSKEAVLLYIVKYAAKAETESSDYRELLKHMAESSDPNSPAATLVRKLLVSSTAERDFSAQEISHLMMGWPLFHSSRSFVTLVIKDENWRKLDCSTDCEDPAIIERYKKRNRELENVTLFEFAQNYRYSQKKILRRRVPAIVRHYPKFKLTDNPAENERYFKIKAVLHTPWRQSMDEIIRPFLSTNFPWTKAYNNIRDTIGEPRFELDVEDSFEDDPELDEFHLHLEPGMAISRAVPQNNEIQNLGRREIDVAHEWEADSVSEEEKKALTDWMTIQKQSFNVATNATGRVAYNLSDDQQRVMDIAMLQIILLTQSKDPEIKRVMVQGKAGSGKSYLISALTQEFRENFGSDSVMLLAPTGAAAINISGKTVHSGLMISPQNFKLLTDEKLRTFQLKMSMVKLIIVDECP